MSDDYNREHAWLPRLRQLDADNHELRRRLRALTDASAAVVAFAGHPIVWRILRDDEKTAIHRLATEITQANPRVVTGFWQALDNQARDRGWEGVA